ncbi:MULTISPECIES: NTP transferase domain-containing protein [Bacillaceae]|uniref:NTP transferase domain-containing protein n=1 Tax=Bacillaceae TaxID=186817 RepID=UPI0011A765D8|nr:MULTISPECIES: NTP transferase domain-containing protein [Bacillaceae]MCM3125247.1 NTP transferase domain-containing protein [Mesobacillus sp. MER 33]MCM3235322.1 NTP transferase domain-containing protein [Mesobacillus sp. MER 48]
MNIIGIYLAAGESKRMGRDKRYLPYHQLPLGSVALNEALESHLDHTIVVTRTEDSLDWLKCKTLPIKWSRMDCLRANDGQGLSIQCGLKKAIEAKADAVMILLADQPFINREVINILIDSYKKEPGCFYIAAGKRQIPMPPVLFSSECFPYLQKLKGDQGARKILRGELFNKGKIIDFHDPLLFFDVDTEEDCVILQALE